MTSDEGPSGETAKSTRKVQWPDERGLQLAHGLDQHGLDPVAFQSLTTALERHSSQSPQPDDHHPPKSTFDDIALSHEKQEDSSGFLNEDSAATSTSGSTSSSSSGRSSPRPQWTVPGNFIDSNEKVGLPGIKNSDGDAHTEAARVVRSHTRKRFGRLRAKPKVLRNVKPRADGNTSGGDRLKRKSTADVEHDAAMSTSSLPIGGGVLSALLTLYNQQDLGSFSSSSTSDHLQRELPPEKPWIHARSENHRRPRKAHEDAQRGRPSSMLSNEVPPEPSSRESSVDTQDRHGHGESKRAKPGSQLFSSIFSDGKPRQARSGAGVLGPLIAGTGNLMGVGSPASGGLQPDVKRPGYHLSRYSMDGKSVASSELELQPLSQLRSDSLPGTGPNSPETPPSLVLPELGKYKSKWNGVLKDLPYMSSVKSFGTRSIASTPGRTPSPTLEGENYFDTKHDSKGEKKRKRKKAEIFITRHVAKIIQRQEFLLKLARAMMMFGGPSHRLQSQIMSAAHVLDIQLSCLYLPDVLLVSFDDSSTSTSSVKLIRQGSALDIGKLHDAYSLYWKVIHDKLSVADASEQLDALMRRPQMYSWWQQVFIGGMCSASICSVSFAGSFIDSLIVFPLGALLVSIQLFSVRNELYSNVFEVTMTTLFSFLSAALAATHHFCYSAVASSSIVLILPGFIVLGGALELMSRNIVAGSVRLCYAVVYAIFLGFGLAMGSKAFEKVSGSAVFGPEDYSCSMTHHADGPWYQKTPSKFWAFMTVPMYSLFLSLRIGARYNRKEIFLLVAVSCVGWVVNHFTGTKFVGQSDVIAAVGAFTVSIVSNFYARFFSGNAFTIMITGILFQVPSGLGSGGLLSYATLQNAGSMTSYISGFQTALNLVSVAIGLTVGLGISLVITHPIQSRRQAGGVFSL